MAEHSLSLAYCTNIWSHHQGPISRELASLLGEDHFRLCLFERVPEERDSLGYAAVAPDYQWIVGPPDTSDDFERLRQTVCDADVAVLGACPQDVQVARVATGKLTFIMSERMCKNPFYWWRMLNPRFAMGIRRIRSISNRSNVHYLAIGEHAIADAKRIGVFDGRLWIWAYFVSRTSGACRERSSSSVRLLWAGRFLGWKRVDIILRAMALLGPAANNCTLELIGGGPTLGAIAKLTRRLGLANRVSFIKSIPHDAVRKRMAEADIYVFPSNRQEGWGAVVGEAMFEGCVVVASKAAGASNALIEHGRTGFLFADGDVRQLAGILLQLIENGELRRRVGQAASMHMQQQWHPRVGAERLVMLCRGLLGLAPIPVFHQGPCRHATEKQI